MIAFVLFVLAIAGATVHILIRKVRGRSTAKTFLNYLLFFNVGLMGLLAFYAHVLMADATAERIGWATGSPFQTEIGIANLSYGVLGILSVWFRGKFSLATVIGYSILLLGAFVVHMIQFSKGDVAPLNIGIFVWFNDLIIPLILLSLVIFLRRDEADRKIPPC